MSLLAPVSPTAPWAASCRSDASWGPVHTARSNSNAVQLGQPMRPTCSWWMARPYDAAQCVRIKDLSPLSCLWLGWREPSKPLPPMRFGPMSKTGEPEIWQNCSVGNPTRRGCHRMKKPKEPGMDAGERRRQAEKKLKERGARGHAGDLALERLVHELEVHQIELEMQNEELGTARNEAETSLRRYTELFDFAPVGYAILAPGETIREVNYACACLLGRARSRLVGARFDAYVAMADRPKLAKLLWRALNGPTRESCEIELTDTERGPVFVRLWANALTLVDEVILLAMEDITERRAAEEKLARSDAALHEAHRHKDGFLATLSHELRNPLAPIRTSLFVLEHAGAGSEQGRKAHAIIDRQVTHLTRLIDDLLDVTRIAQGTVKLARDKVDVAELVRRTVEDRGAGFGADGPSVEAVIETGPLWVDADPPRIVQIISSLLDSCEK